MQGNLDDGFFMPKTREVNKMESGDLCSPEPDGLYRRIMAKGISDFHFAEMKNRM